ncbi:MAG: hypothetical protein PHS80_01875 [Methanothrix sp.]|nr:hypothetical protein [Methanothrix sp.]
MQKSMICVLVISLISFGIFAGMASAHDPSEEADSAHTHQLPPPWPYHVIMVLAGAISLAGGAFTARYLKKRTRWIELHKKLALSGVVLVLAGIFVAAYMVSAYMETPFVREMHAYLGASVFIFIIVTPMLGIFQFRSKDMRIHTIHRWSGRITIMLILLTIIAGIQMVLTVLAYDVMSMPIK